MASKRADRTRPVRKGSVTITCECGHKGRFRYGERWKCPGCGRKLATNEISPDASPSCFLTACFTEHGFCCHTEKCIVRDPLQKVHEGILKLLSSITIADMALDTSKASAEQDLAETPERLYGVALTPTAI